MKIYLSYFFMLRAKKALFVLSASFSLEFLSFGFFTNGISPGPLRIFRLC
jgi:hypothetical protein